MVSAAMRIAEDRYHATSDRSGRHARARPVQVLIMFDILWPES